MLTFKTNRIERYGWDGIHDLQGKIAYSAIFAGCLDNYLILQLFTNMTVELECNFNYALHNKLRKAVTLLGEFAGYNLLYYRAVR